MIDCCTMDFSSTFQPIATDFSVIATDFSVSISGHNVKKISSNSRMGGGLVSGHHFVFVK